VLDGQRCFLGRRIELDEIDDAEGCFQSMWSNNVSLICIRRGSNRRSIPRKIPRNAKDLLEQTMNLSLGRGAIITRDHLTESDNRGNQTTEKTATPIGASERQELSLGGADLASQLQWETVEIDLSAQ
jgi:hypothetical protein